MSTPDDVQRAAARLSDLPSSLTVVEQLGKNIWNTLVELGWIPPGVGGAAPAELQAAHDAGYTEAQTEAQFQIERAYAEGRREGLDEGCTRPHFATSPDDWTPVPLRWRHIRPGDVFVTDNRTWMVLACGQSEPGWLVNVVNGEDLFDGVEVDPDEAVAVLCPVSEAHALARAREELDGTVVDRTV